MRSTSSLLCLLLLFAGFASSCEKDQDPDITCGCTLAPKGPFTPAQLSLSNPWWLQEVNVGGQSTKGNAIKDRYSIRFRPDGTYTQTLLADGTEYQGTWMLMGSGNETLHLIDHKGDSQEYTMQGANADNLIYSRTNKTGQMERYLFGSTL